MFSPRLGRSGFRFRRLPIRIILTRWDVEGNMMVWCYIYIYIYIYLFYLFVLTVYPFKIWNYMFCIYIFIVWYIYIYIYMFESLLRWKKHLVRSQGAKGAALSRRTTSAASSRVSPCSATRVSKSIPAQSMPAGKKSEKGLNPNLAEMLRFGGGMKKYENVGKKITDFHGKSLTFAVFSWQITDFHAPFFPNI